MQTLDLDNLLAQQADIAKKIAEVRSQKHAEAIAQVRTLIAQFGLKQDDIFGGARETKKNKPNAVRVPAKYRDPVSGSEWSGRGVTPKWLRGQDKSTFLISDSK